MELDAGELRDAVDGKEHVELAIGMPQLADVDVDVADRRLGEAATLRGGFLACRQARDAVPVEASMKRAARQLWDRIPQASQNVVQRQQRSAPELDDHGLLDRRQYGAAGIVRSHRRVGCRGAPPPLRDGLRVQAVARRHGAGAFLRRLEFGSNTRRRSALP